MFCPQPVSYIVQEERYVAHGSGRERKKEDGKHKPNLLDQRVHVALIVGEQGRRSDDDDGEEVDDGLIGGFHFWIFWILKLATEIVSLSIKAGKTCWMLVAAERYDALLL